MQWEKLQPKYLKIIDEGHIIVPDTEVISDIPIIISTVEEAVARFFVYDDAGVGDCYESIRFVRGMDTDTINCIKDAFGDVYEENDEGYFIDTTTKDIVIRSATDRGLYYGAQAIAVFLEGSKNIVKSLVAYEYPICPERGVKCYIPGMKHIAYFKKFVDLMCRYRHNMIIIEVGGAMEYMRYPEINVEWVNYCKDISEYSGKSVQIQEATYAWDKNSMHVENGDGGYISQDIMRELVLYCKERFIDVVPEVMSLSHCDYIVRAYPEISERAYDPYPDTYCPSNPKSYRILFGLLDEIIDVFEPDIIHVGHDEYYTYGKCPRCRGRDPVELFAGDVNKIYDFLSGQGIRMMLWADKFLNAHNAEGKPAGGADKPPHPAWENENIICEAMGPTFKSIDKVPRDIKMLHWYWRMDEGLEMDFHNRNMPTTYGNFVGTHLDNFKKRIKQGMLGGLCSNWSTLSEEIMQWNGVIYNTAFNALIFWDPDYDSNKKYETMETAAKDIYHYLNLDALYGEPTGNYIKAVHTTNLDMPFINIHDGIFLDEGKYLLGHYIVSCDNGRVAKIPVIYGKSIACDTDGFKEGGPQMEQSDGDVSSIINKVKAVACQALPFVKDGKTWYQAILKIPIEARGFKITDVRFEQSTAGCEVLVESVAVI